MKTLVPIITITAALALCGATAAREQAAAETAATAEVQQAAQQAQAEAQAVKDAARAVQVEVKQQAAQVQKDYEQARRQIDAALAQASAAGGRVTAYDARTDSYIVQDQDGSKRVIAGTSVPAYRDRLQAIVSRPDNASKTLVIRSSDADPKAQANLEEDLVVMSRILDKASAQVLAEDGPRRVMGINVLFAPGSSPVRSLYLEGYGALFFLNASFPLLPPPAKAEAQKEEPKVDSAWEEARREVYGQPNEVRAISSAGTAPAVEYSEDKVNKLKDTLLEVLKDATNIRNLKSDDSVTVCVFGGAGAATTGARVSSTVRVIPMSGNETLPATATSVVKDSRTGQMVITTSGEGGRPAQGSILTIRVKKADADAFAKGKLTLGEFRKKASITAYAGDVGGGRQPPRSFF